MKIFLVASDIFSTYNFRLPLIKFLQTKGHKVVAVAPFLKFDHYVNLLKKNDVECINLKMDIWGTNPIKDALVFYQLLKIYHSEKPDIVQHFTIKMTIYGTLAARIANIKNIHNMITGMPFAFTLNSPKYKLVRTVIKLLSRISLTYSTNTFFANKYDRDFFVSHKLAKAGKTTVIPGPGVDTDFFRSKNLPAFRKNTTFLFVGRMLQTKGVREFVEAARQVKQKHPKTLFLLLGMVEEGNPLSINPYDLNRWQSDGVAVYLGMKNDVRAFIEEADVIVLPSYSEGFSRSLLEAISMSRPVIGTNIPGCREVVVNGLNGFIVPVKDVSALVETMEKFILNPQLKITMGIEGRKLAVKKFDVRKVNEIILTSWGLL